MRGNLVLEKDLQLVGVVVLRGVQALSTSIDMFLARRRDAKASRREILIESVREVEIGIRIEN